MTKVFILNGHQPHTFAEGRLNAAFDVMKYPEIEADLARFDAHLDTHFPPLEKETGHGAA